MVKRKKQEFFINKYYKFSAIMIALACLILMFIPSLSLKLGGTEISTINMWQSVFGAEITFSFSPTAKFGFSILVLLIPALLAVAGLIPFFIPRNLGTLIALGCFVTAAVFSFMLPVLSMPSADTAALYKLGLSAGSILIGALSIIGGGLSVVKLVV